eukprot:TRINITY_DN2503_c0_g2_i1.p1 TRINITY_DN2503_c0_g2~~TRINITY_DN2503_c0_g2_i1.p1  ORF type:complete len:157 (-),score=6.40 TRINITY_DN2503_c0_g2_i1:769-1239(-)
MGDVPEPLQQLSRVEAPVPFSALVPGQPRNPGHHTHAQRHFTAPIAGTWTGADATSAPPRSLYANDALQAALPCIRNAGDLRVRCAVLQEDGRQVLVSSLRLSSTVKLPSGGSLTSSQHITYMWRHGFMSNAPCVACCVVIRPSESTQSQQSTGLM